MTVGKRRQKIEGPALVGECEFFLTDSKLLPVRLHSVIASVPMDVLELDVEAMRKVPVIVDNIRRIIRQRRLTIYQDLEQIDQKL